LGKSRPGALSLILLCRVEKNVDRFVHPYQATSRFLDPILPHSPTPGQLFLLFGHLGYREFGGRLFSIANLSRACSGRSAGILPLGHDAHPSLFLRLHR
jgi:hypothetical protein